MKRLFTSFLLLTLSITTLAQKKRQTAEENGDVKFEDGTVYNFHLLETNPDVDIDWTVMGVFRPVYFEKLLPLTFGVKASKKLWDRVNLRGMASGGWHVDVSMPDNEDYKDLQKQYQHLHAELGIKIFDEASMKTSYIQLGDSVHGNLITTYYVKGKMRYKQSYGIFGGIGYTQRRVASDQQYEGTVIDTNENGLANFTYKPLTIYQTNLRLGIDVTWINSSWVEIDHVRQATYQHARLYTMALLPMQQRIDVAKIPNNDVYSNDPAVMATSADYVMPGFSSWGYLVGFELLNEFNSSGKVFGVSMEVGLLPGIDYNSVFDNFTASISYSIGFGTNLSNKWDKRMPRN